MTLEPETRIASATAEDKVDRLLRAWSDGDRQAPSQLLPLLYDDMRRTARAFARGERQDHTLQPTAVVHEAWIQMVGSNVQSPEAIWESREHFLGVAARTMRRVLVDYARSRNCIKRGGDRQRVPLLDDTFLDQPGSNESALLQIAIDRALDHLEAFAPQDAKIVELRFFGGLTLDETAECMGVSRRTVVRVWRRAKAWLRAELQEGPEFDT